MRWEKIHTYNMIENYDMDILNDNDNKEEISCIVCNAKFDYILDLNFHLKSDHDISTTYFDKPISSIVKCKYCDVMFVSTTELKKHEAKYGNHEFIDCLQCDICFKLYFRTKIYAHMRTLKSHIRREHNNEYNLLFEPKNTKPLFKCCYCSKKFFRDANCQDHERIHIQPNSFKDLSKHDHQCYKCELSFDYKRNLYDHITLYHTTYYICSICNVRKFDSIDKLKKHINSHYPFECYKCLQRFPDYYNFDTHVRLCLGSSL